MNFKNKRNLIVDVKDLDSLNTIPSEITRNAARCVTDDGLYSDPKDCSKYRICKSGVLHEMRCENNRMFDVYTGKCNYISAETCRPGQTVSILFFNHTIRYR